MDNETVIRYTRKIDILKYSKRQKNLYNNFFFPILIITNARSSSNETRYSRKLLYNFFFLLLVRANGLFKGIIRRRI